MKNGFSCHQTSTGYFLCIAISLANTFSTHSYAEVHGQVNIQLQNDNRQNMAITYTQQQANITYFEKHSELRAAFAFSARQALDASNDSENRIQQLFIENAHLLSDNSKTRYAFGRLPRSDGLGFYYIDGFNLDLDFYNWTFSTYSGKPGRIDDFYTMTGDLVSGINVKTQINEIHLPYIDTFSARLGWQRYENTTTEDRIYWGIYSHSGISPADSSPRLLERTEITLNGTWLAESKQAEDLQAGIKTRWSTNLDINLNWESYQPDKTHLTFREQFYYVYSRGNQDTYITTVNYFPSEKYLFSIKQRNVEREFANNGYGTSFSYQYRQDNGNKWLFHIDKLALNHDSARSYYIELAFPFSATLQTGFAVAKQKQYKSLYGSNNATAIEAKIEKMLKSDLFFNLSSSYIFNSRLNNEYRTSLRLEYYFDDRLFKSLNRDGASSVEQKP